MKIFKEKFFRGSVVPTKIILHEIFFTRKHARRTYCVGIICDIQEVPYTWIFSWSKIFANFANDVHIAKIFYANILTRPTRHDRQPE